MGKVEDETVREDSRIFENTYTLASIAPTAIGLYIADECKLF